MLVGTRVRLKDPDLFKAGDTREQIRRWIREQSKGMEGTVTEDQDKDIPLGQWCTVKWDHGGSWVYPYEYLEDLSPFRMEDPEFSLDDIEYAGYIIEEVKAS